MPRPPRKSLTPAVLAEILANGPNEPSPEAKAVMLSELGHDEATTTEIYCALLERLATNDSALRQAGEAVESGREMCKQFLADRWQSALVLGLIEADDGRRAVVLAGGRQHVVTFHARVAADDVSPGENVFLNDAGNCVIARPGTRSCGGELAEFVRLHDDGRLLVKCQQEELLLTGVPGLQNAPFVPGDLVRMNREAYLAFERVPRRSDAAWLAEESIDVARASIGGQSDCFKRLLDALAVTLIDPERAARYGLSGKKTVLLHGPNGVGKTLMVKAAMAEVQALSGRKCKLIAVRPAEWYSEWIGRTESNIRTFFQAVGEQARGGLVVVLLDEVDAIGRIRGGSTGQHSDRFLNALLAEVDGFCTLGNVALISATNQKSLLDPALLERLSAVDIAVGRPGLRASREILEVHFPPSPLPYYPNGAEARHTREQIIETAVSRLFSVESVICRIRFRDGKDRVVTARELLSGRMLMQLSELARRRAFHGEPNRDGPGVRVEDVHAAVDETLDRLRSTLSLQNAHAWLDDLPQDLAIVAVEPLGGKIKRARFFHHES